LQLSEQRGGERQRRVVPIIQPPDPDLFETESRSVTLPVSWWVRLEAAGKARGADRFSAVIQLMRWTLDQPQGPPTVMSAELKGPKKTNSVYLAARRWAQLREEMERRGWSLNTTFQAHLLRALSAEEADIASERRPKR
jgi:hypothetical protein